MRGLEILTREKYRSQLLIVPMAMTIAATLAFAATKILSIKSSSEIVVEAVGEAFSVSKSETKFVEDFFAGSGKRLYQVDTTSEFRTDAEGMKGNSKVQSYGLERTTSKKQWSLSAEGTEFKVFGQELLDLTIEGCCDEGDRNQLINKVSGKIVAIAINDSTFEISVPNSNLNYRYLAEILDPAAPKKRGEKTYIGTVAYFDSVAVRGRARVYADLKPGWSARLLDFKPLLVNERDQLSGNRIELWSKDGSTDSNQSFTDFGLTAKVMFDSNEEELTIMLIGDQLNERSSRATNNLAIEFVP